MVPLMMPPASCDTDTSANSIKGPSCTSLQLSLPKEWYDVIFNAIGTVWCQHWCCWHDMNKESCFASFWSLWPNKCTGAINNSIGIPKDMSRHKDSSSHFVDTSRHFLDVQTCLDTYKHCLDPSRCCLHTSRHCLETSYCLLCAIVLSMPISPQTQHLQLL